MALHAQDVSAWPRTPEEAGAERGEQGVVSGEQRGHLVREAHPEKLKDRLYCSLLVTLPALGPPRRQWERKV
jgi:hypothetical protein